MTNLNENEIAYNFKLDSCANEQVSLDDIKNKYIILYFYPKDDTSGCTMQAKEFSSLKNEFTQLDAVIFGISKDNINSHNKFIEKYHLEIDLLSDAQGVAEKYGVWVEKSMYGKKYMGIERTTFLIGEGRKILKIWKKVKPAGHAEEVLNYIKLL